MMDVMTDVRQTCGNPSVNLAGGIFNNCYSAAVVWALLLNNSVFFSTASSNFSMLSGCMIGLDWGNSARLDVWLGSRVLVVQRKKVSLTQSCFGL